MLENTDGKGTVETFTVKPSIGHGGVAQLHTGTEALIQNIHVGGIAGPVLFIHARIDINYMAPESTEHVLESAQSTTNFKYRLA